MIGVPLISIFIVFALLYWVGMARIVRSQILMLKEQEYVILLDLWGEMVDSERFSIKLDQLQTYQTSNLTFVIAGSLGPGKNVYDRCNWKWKLSDLTFTHQMTRVLVLEQIYRAFMIQNNNPYHK